MKRIAMFMALSLLGASVAVAADAPAADAKADPKPAAAKPPAASDEKAAAGNRVELQTTQITGNRELPRVLYVVPWKRADLGELAGKPARSLLDEVLAPVDRDVFRRQNRYHDALQPDAAGSKGDAAADVPKGER